MKKRISKVILATTLLFGSVATNIKATDKIDFVAIGDSITTGYGLDGYTSNPPYAKGSFVEVLKESMSLNTTNMAKDGITSAELLLATQALSAEQQAIIKGADVISVNIGGNDLLRRLIGDLENAFGIDPNDKTAMAQLATAIADPADGQTVENILLNMLKDQTIVGNFTNNLTAIIHNIKNINSTGQIIVQTIANPYDELPDLTLAGFIDAINAGICGFNGIIKQGSATGAYSVADVYSVFKSTLSEGVFPGLTNATNPATPLDPHPTALGHGFIAVSVFNAMSSMYSHLISVQNTFTPITDLENGVPKTVEGLKLPTKASIETTVNHSSQPEVATLDINSQIQDAEILWDLKNCKYDPALKTAQKFTVTGTVVLPKFVSNDDNIPLEVSIEVSVKAGKEEPTKPEEPAKPEEPKKPEEPAKPAEPTKPAEPSVPEKKPEAVVEAKKTPETSDTTSLVALSISALVACGAMLVLKYRKNSKAIK